MPEEVVLEQQPPEAPAEPEKVEPEAKPDAETEQTDAERDDKGRFRKSVQPRIDELTRQRHEAEREAAYWRGVAQSAKPSSEKSDAPKPDPKDFQDHNEFVEKLAEWKADQRIAAALQEREKQEQQAKTKAERETRASTWVERQAKFAESAPDFEQVMDSAEVRMPAHVLDALLEHEQGPALAYHLARNPADAERLSRMSERQAMFELGRLESSLKPSKSVTKAPAPITPVKAGGGNVTDLAKMSQAEYEAHRKTQGAWWAR